MSQIQTVALAGASGTLGSPVLKALVDFGFNVTVLTRTNTPGAYDSNIKVLEVDYTSLSSLTTALKGIDAVVSTVNGGALDCQYALIDAAIAAGVKRFIPSEFGGVTTNPKLESYPLYDTTAKVRRHVQDKAAEGKISWTVLRCGAFLDFLLNTPFWMDFANHSLTLFDEGDNRLTATSLSTIGRAIAAILANSEATKDRVVCISETIVTQNQVLGYAKELRPDIQWEISQAQTSALLAESLKNLDKEGFTLPAVMEVIKSTTFAGDTYGAAYDETDNELLGVAQLPAEEVKRVVGEKLAGKQYPC